MPAEFTDSEVRLLEDKTWYPGYFYNSVTGLKQRNALLKDYENGIIDPSKVRFRGPMTPFKKRKRGQKCMPEILGSELKRIHPTGDGRIIGHHRLNLERLAS